MKNKWWLKILLIVGICLFVGIIINMVFTNKEFKGTDDKIRDIIKVYTQKAGITQRASYFNMDRGDLLLFLFCFAGLVVGFYLGYQWREIITQRPMVNNLPTITPDSRRE